VDEDVDDVVINGFALSLIVVFWLYEPGGLFEDKRL
jgi:hypothetical protein